MNIKNIKLDVQAFVHKLKKVVLNIHFSFIMFVWKFVIFEVENKELFHKIMIKSPNKKSYNQFKID